MMEALLAEQERLEQKGSLAQALDHVDGAIARLTEARDAMASGTSAFVLSPLQCSVSSTQARN